jgi:hypothetical protein
MKGKRPAKLAARGKKGTEVVEEKVAIEYIELTITNPDTDVVETTLLRTNFGTVEAASENAPGLVGLDRAGLERHIVQGEEAKLLVERKSLVGINYLRLSLPRLDARLKHFAPKEA